MPEFDIHSCDHLGLLSTSFNRLLSQKNVDKIRDALKQNKEAAELDHLPYLFSDYVEKFDSKLRRQTCILLITQKSLYLFNPKDVSVLSVNALTQLAQILMVRSNDSLLGLKMVSTKDQFLESVRRVDVVVFVTTNAELTGLKAPKVVQASKINLSQKKHSQIINFKSSAFSAMNL